MDLLNDIRLDWLLRVLLRHTEFDYLEMFALVAKLTTFQILLSLLAYFS